MPANSIKPWQGEKNTFNFIYLCFAFFSLFRNSTLDAAVQSNCQRTGDPRTFYVFFIMGAIYVAIYSIVSLNIRRLRMDIVLSENIRFLFKHNLKYFRIC